jgi:hypothetical protein
MTMTNPALQNLQSNKSQDDLSVLIERKRDWEHSDDLAAFWKWLILVSASGIFIVVCVLAAESNDIFYWLGALASGWLLTWLIFRLTSSGREL